MQNRVLWVFGSLGALALFVLAVIGFLLTHERVEQRQVGDWPKAARTNPFLAAERLLTQLGQSARSVPTLGELPDGLPGNHDFLLLNTPSSSLSEAQHAALLAWVERGGHLLLAPRHFAAAGKSAADTPPGKAESTAGASSSSVQEPEAELRPKNPAKTEEPSGDALLDALRIRPQSVNTNECATILGGIFSGVCPHPANVTLARAGVRPLQIRFNPGRALIDLNDDARWALASPSGLHLVQRVWGNGFVTVVSDLDWLRNDAIGSHDHAALWWHLLNMNSRPTTVWLQYLPEVPPWWLLLVNNALPLLLASGLWLVLWLLRSAQRFGPLVPLPDPARRSLLEHIRASGYWLWHQQAAQTLLEAQRHALRRQLMRRHPGWAERSPAEQAVYLAHLTGLPAPRIEQALTATTPKPRVREFIQQMEDLRRLGHVL